ncbi:MAG: ROK family protein [Burkholderiales bacterium]
MNVLVIDVGGTHVKILATGQQEVRRMDSGPALTPRQMVRGVKALARGWKYDRISIGYPGVVVRDQVRYEPHNLGKGWVGFDFAKAFGCPVRMVNDAAMQALGGYEGGKMLFLGFGTGLGTTLIVDGMLVPMELAHLPYRKATFEDYVGEQSLEHNGRKRWRMYAVDVIERLTAALEPDDVVLGGGNAVHLGDALPPRCRLGANANAFPGGFRLWADGAAAKRRAAKKRTPRKRS